MFYKLLLCAALTFSLAQADLQYQSTSRVTGGSLIQIMRFVPGGGALKEPQVSTVVFQKNRMARRSKRQGEIIDLDKRTITTINFDKRTYSEVTFEQMKQALDQASAQAQEQSAKAQQQAGAQGATGAKVNLDLDADIKDTGQTRTVNGFDAHEILMTMSMTATDPQSGGAGALKVNSDMWIAKDLPGTKEVREFYMRMSKELDWAPTGMGGMMNRPDIAKAMAKMMAEGGKIDGTAVQQVMRVTMEGTGTGAGTTQGQQSQQAARPSLSDALGGALGGKLGGLGGFGKRKKQDSDTPSAQPASADASSQQNSASLMEMTIDNTGYTTSGIDSSVFDVPAGFKKVEEDPLGGRPRK
jgi:hypothetical protein